ncbi:MAG: V-type ATP synthase subunit E family protein [Thermoplasmata archaeon]
MGLDQLVQEIQARAQEELAKERSRIEGERANIATDLEQRLALVREENERMATSAIARERAQKLASARLQARKLIDEAREREMEDALAEVRNLLEQYTRTKEYGQLLKKMYQSAQEVLGGPIRISGRKEDQSTLESIAGKSLSKTPAPIMGGLIAETPNGDRRLNLSFDELLRLREDKVRSVLMG